MTRLGERTVRGTLDRLDRRGLLVLHIRGRASTDPARRRANLYRLPDPAALPHSIHIPVPGDPVYGTHGQVYGTPRDPAVGTPARSMGRTAPQPAEQEETAMVTVTISASDPETLAATLAALQRDPAVAVRPEPEQPPATPRLSVVRDTGTSSAPRRRSRGT